MKPEALAVLMLAKTKAVSVKARAGCYTCSKR